MLRHKAAYLNTGFFLLRALVYFSGWILIAWTMTRWSRRQDEGDMSVNLRLQYLSGGGLVFYALAATFASIDWIMSINPHWYSTLFGFIFIGGQGLSALAFTIVVGTFLARRAPMDTLLKPSHFHDLGKLSLAFVMLWAYFNFSQYMLCTRRTSSRRSRISSRESATAGSIWPCFSSCSISSCRLLLLSRDLKRMPHRLVWVALALLVVRYIDLFMLVSPEFDRQAPTSTCSAGEHEAGFYVHWLDLAAPLAIGGLWLWMFFTQLAQRPLLAFGDPYLREALESTGGH